MLIIVLLNSGLLILTLYMLYDIELIAYAYIEDNTIFQIDIQEF